MNIDNQTLTSESSSDITIYDFTKKTLSNFNGWILLILLILIVIVIIYFLASLFSYK